MKLHATITNEKGKTVSKGGNNDLDITLKVGNQIIGHIYLDYHADTERNGDDSYESSEYDEWVLQFHNPDKADPDIIAQGHITSKTLHSKECEHGCIKDDCLQCNPQNVPF